MMHRRPPFFFLPVSREEEDSWYVYKPGPANGDDEWRTTIIIGPIGYFITKCHEVINTSTTTTPNKANCASAPSSACDKARTERTDFKRGQKATLSNYSFAMFRNLIIQGDEVKDNGTPIRIVLLTWYFFCIVVYSLYSGTLTAFLTIPAYEKPIDSLQDLLRSVKDGFAPAVQSGTSNEYILKRC
ncbi:hypothetical protein SK128_011265 [Halocaridina rubra]|uniref:Ionotropic glutamate receptor C-terminal domain-containing protein n=1 Tax=Halocaridina rubra TaxID=373956 RepID=A0AAN8XRC9_HALRR